MTIQIKQGGAPISIDPARREPSKTILMRGNPIAHKPDQGVAVAEIKAERVNLGGRPQGAFGEDSVADRISKLDVEQSVSAAVRFEKKPSNDVAEKTYRGMAATLHAGATRVGKAVVGFEFKIERGCFETRDKAVIYVVAITRTA
ncbi:MAG: hypothetical protein V4787_11505 [Pseudomonadota bacterium]